MNAQLDERAKDSVRTNIFNNIRIAEFSTSEDRLREVKELLPPETVNFLEAIKLGRADAAKGSVEMVMDLLCTFEIPLERAVPLWPIPKNYGSRGQDLAACRSDASVKSNLSDEFFLRLSIIKEIFCGEIGAAA